MNREVQKKKTEDFSDMRKLMTELFPEQKLTQHPLDDSEAKTLKNAWKNESHQHPFLINLCKAIHVVFNMKAEVKGKQLQCGEHILELNDVEAYLREPRLKLQLWKTLSRKLYRT